MSPHLALLLTDIVNSTEITRRLGDERAVQLWQEHDRIARSLMRQWGGREVDKTDGVLLLFERVEDAVACAQAYHGALAAAGMPFQSRAGVHVGPVTMIENGAEDVARGAKPLEAEGLAVPTVARVMSVARPGQTLLSGEAREALTARQREGLAPDFRLRSQGHWRLAGLDEPVALHELLREGGGGDPPQDHAKAYRVIAEGDRWKPVREVPHNMPSERDRFVGRRAALERLLALREQQHRLITIIGMGGVGKTRLALRHAWSWLGEYPGGVFFCDLVAARDAAALQWSVAQALDVPLGVQDPAGQLSRALAGRGRCLVILDNFEQLVRLAEESVGRWLDRAPEAQVLVTSRVRLGLAGEALLELAPMDTREAVSLFKERAAALGARPTAQGEDDAIPRLVGMLDGLPLAIELAAARARVMSPQVMLGRMHERFALLTQRGRGGDRRTALRATIAWSWELLDAAEQALLAQLSVFVGGFTLAACEAVAQPEGGDAAAVDLLQSLVDRSLVRVCSDNRFDLLQSVAAFAAEALQQRPQEPGASAGRHAAYFAALAGSPSAEAVAAELDNLVAACRHAAGRGDGALATQLLEGVRLAVGMRGPWSVLVDQALAVLALEGLKHDERLSALLAGAAGHHFGGSTDRAAALYESALPLAVDTARHDLRARTLRGLADQRLRAGDTRGWEDLHVQALTEARLAGDAELTCSFMNRAANVVESMGRMGEARAGYEEALATARRLGQLRWIGGSAGNLGQCLANLGEHERALAMYTQALQVAHELGDRQWEANTRCNLGLLHLERGEPELALPELVWVEATARALGHARLRAVACCNLGLVLEALSRFKEAEASFEQAIGLARELGDERGEGQYLGYLGAMQARCGSIEAGRLALGAARERLATAGDPLSHGIVLAASAVAEAAAGDGRQAAQFLGAARAIAASQPGLQAGSELARGLAQAQAALALALSQPGRR